MTFERQSSADCLHKQHSPKAKLERTYVRRRKFRKKPWKHWLFVPLHTLMRKPSFGFRSDLGGSPPLPRVLPANQNLKPSNTLMRRSSFDRRSHMRREPRLGAQALRRRYTPAGAPRRLRRRNLNQAMPPCDEQWNTPEVPRYLPAGACLPTTPPLGI